VRSSELVIVQLVGDQLDTVAVRATALGMHGEHVAFDGRW
jgi:hypothetical protein